MPDLKLAEQWWRCAGASYNALNRYRMALIGLFAVATALQMWAANVLLNLAGLLRVCLAIFSRPSPKPSPLCVLRCELSESRHDDKFCMRKIGFMPQKPWNKDLSQAWSLTLQVIFFLATLQSKSMLCAADSDATDFLGDTEVTRARVTLIGYCATAAL